MTETVLPPLRGVAVYNPDLLNRAELVGHFVARKVLLNRLIDDLRSATRSGVYQHQLLVGQRGMGKTMLLRRVRYAVEDDPELGAHWLPLTFPEEQYNVANLSDFYLNCADALGDTLDSLGLRDQAKALDAARDQIPNEPEPQRARAALDLLLHMADKIGKRLLLLVDNVQLILDRLKDDQWTIRELLSSEKRLLLVGASAEAMESTYDYGKAFYDFFRINELRGLTEAETREVLANLAGLQGAASVSSILENDPARIRALHVLTGGNPRTVVLLFGVLARENDGDVRTDLEQLLDLSTPLYQSRFEALATQAQQIVDALALAWDPLSAGELAERVRLDVNAVSSHLNRLAQQGVVERVSYHPSTKTGFQIAERFFNIWYLMRASRRIRQRLIWLVHFLRLMYSSDELEKRARKHLHHDNWCDSRTALHHAEYGLALAQLLDAPPLRRALESDAIHGLVVDRDLRQQLALIVDLDGADVELRPHVEGAEWATNLRDSVLALRIKSPSWDATRFAELLAGRPSMSRTDKTALVTKLQKMTAARIKAIHDVLVQEYERTAQRVTPALASKLYLALASGRMNEQADLDGAQVASIQLDAPGLVAVACLGLLNGRPNPDLQRIESELRALLARDPSQVAWLALGECLFRQERFDEAGACYEKAIEADSTFGHAYGALAFLLHYQLKRFVEAEGAYRKAVGIDDKNASAWFGLGDLYQDYLNRFGDSETAYQKTIALRPRWAAAWRHLGDLLASKPDRLGEAEGIYRKALELDESDPQSWSSLGHFLSRRLHRYGEAESALRKVVELRPNETQGWLRLANILEAAGRPSESEAACRKALELEPNNTHAWQHLAASLKDQERPDEAELALRRAIDLDPTDPGLWLALGNLFGALGRTEQAEPPFREALKLNPTYVPAWASLGRLLATTDRKSEAEMNLRQAIQLDPRDDRPLNWLGDLLHTQARWEEAEAVYRKAVALDPTHACPWAGLGAVLAQSANRLADAEGAYRKAVELAPNNSSWQRGLASILKRLGRDSESLLTYRRAAEAAPDNARGWNEYAWALYSSGQKLEEAERAARRAIELDPAELAAVHTLAVILASQGSWNEARVLARRFLGEGSPEFLEEEWREIVRFFREAVKTGHASGAVQLLNETGMGERWRPLREALSVLAENNPALLLRVAPEVRQPAEVLLRELSVTTGSDPGSIGPQESAPTNGRTKAEAESVRDSISTVRKRLPPRGRRSKRNVH